MRIWDKLKIMSTEYEPIIQEEIEDTAEKIITYMYKEKKMSERDFLEVMMKYNDQYLLQYGPENTEKIMEFMARKMAYIHGDDESVAEEMIANARSKAFKDCNEA